MAVPSSGQLKLNGDINLEINGTGTGTNVSLNGLSILAGFTAPNGMKEFYGYTAVALPSVTTNAISSIAATSLTLNGDVTGDGGGTISERGFYFGTDNSSATNNTKYTVSGTTGAFTLAQTGLTTGTTYYAWAFATNEAGTTIASIVSATPILSFLSLATNYMRYYPSYYSPATFRHYYSDGAGGWTLKATITQSSFGSWNCRAFFADGIQNRVYVTGINNNDSPFFDRYTMDNRYASCTNTLNYSAISATKTGGSLSTSSYELDWSSMPNGASLYFTP